MSVISEVQDSFCKTPLMVHITKPLPPCHVGMVQLPSSPNASPIVPLAVDSNHYGMDFWQSGLRINPKFSTDDTSTLVDPSREIW